MTTRAVYVLADSIEAAGKLATLITHGKVPDVHCTHGRLVEHWRRQPQLMQHRYRPFVVTMRTLPVARVLEIVPAIVDRGA